MQGFCCCFVLLCMWMLFGFILAQLSRNIIASIIDLKLYLRSPKKARFHKFFPGSHKCNSWFSQTSVYFLYILIIWLLIFIQCHYPLGIAFLLHGSKVIGLHVRGPGWNIVESGVKHNKSNQIHVTWQNHHLLYFYKLTTYYIKYIEIPYVYVITCYILE